MSGATFATKGSTGAAPRTVWMQSLADRLTMGMRWTEGNSPGNYQVLVSPYNQPCLFANQHLNYNTSFGAFTTAPDGTTSSAQYIAEDSSTGTHYIGCMANQWFGGLPYLRMAGIYKADTRTRICFEARNLDGSNTIDVGFDLAGGQIAYGPIINGGMLAFNWEIHPVVGFPGWWLCILDAQLQSTAILNEELFRVFLDNGSGTGAQSISYAGNTSTPHGVYGWKTSILPLQAWKINGTALFNDFHDLSRVDVTNSKAPGFDFYQQASAPWQNWQPPQAAAFGIAGSGSLSITGGTVLNIPAGGRVPANSTIECALGFACQTTPGNYVGRGFVPPFYVEANYTLGVSHAASDISNTTWWGTKLEFILNLASPNSNRYMLGSEIDWNDWLNFEFAGGFNASGPICGGISYINSLSGTPGVNIGPAVSTRANVFLGCAPVYSSLLSQYSNLPYSSIGSFWYANPAGPNAMPPGSTWHAYTYGTTTAGTVSVNEPPIIFDPEQFHTYGILMVPYDPISGSPGCEIHFYEGGYTSVSMGGWGPNTGNPWMYRSDWQQCVTWFNPGGAVGSGFDFNIDWIRVSQ